MAETTKKVHPRMAEAIANAELAAVSNRGMYPMTKAANVKASDGTSLEDETSTGEPDSEPEKVPDRDPDADDEGDEG